VEIKKQYCIKNILVAIIISTIVLTISSPCLAQKNAWKLRKNKNGIEVYTRKVNNSNLVEFKVTATLQASLLKVRKIIDDVESYPLWMANLEQSGTIKKISNTERYDYFEIKVPWPFENRDMVMHVKSLFSKNKIIHLEILNSQDYIPAKENMVRIQEAEGSWHFLLVEENTTKITYQLYSDPGGNIPNWVIDLLIVDGPYKTILNLQELVKKG